MASLRRLQRLSSVRLDEVKFRMRIASDTAWIHFLNMELRKFLYSRTKFIASTSRAYSTVTKSFLFFLRGHLPFFRFCKQSSTFWNRSSTRTVTSYS